MGIFDYFKRSPPIRDRDELADFIDRNAAFLIQKAIYEYSRARAGHYAKVLFKEPEFHKAVEKSRWHAFPLGIAMVAETAEGVLRSRTSGDRLRDFEALVAIALSVFDRYQVPDIMSEQVWRELRVDLEQRLRRIALHPVKRAMDVPEQYAALYFDLMPIHEKLRGRDFETTRNYLKVALCNIHDELTKRIEGQPLAELSGAH